MGRRQKKRDKGPRANGFRVPKESLGKRKCSFFYENRGEGWNVSLAAKKPEDLRVDVEGVHEIESVMD